ncbi:metal ABC transporter solute-binding protein, Zn/Mn family [Roseitranquillus sediminis]|uniref:metal ABC transporter solute-binding protein, Zn/Mn family n=1 Tax=Roseitranquillus sediminis TaxID=2809051 RepID=UPI001D0C9757|nr:zinc ABC transporter substrate-binding protein [Roseitranquillus sediminis]MBM9593048.1 zinc ABC transporter substrate-binding protein [Roseitranquillus sediminis]
MLSRIAILCALILWVALPARAQAPLQVVTTTGMIADAAREVGGEHVEVRSLMGPGVDPHSYRQTRSDIAALTRADLVLWHGLYLEAQMEELLEKLAERQPVVAVAEALPRERLLSYGTYEGRWDPHVWMDPELWGEVVLSVRDALSDARPEAAEDFGRNADVYREKLTALDGYAAEVTATVPEGRRVLVTAHDAFSYFGDAYDVEVLGIQGISTESEAGLARIGELVDLLVERDIGAVFVESSVSDRNVRALAEGAAAQGHEVRIGGELYSDAMGEPGTYEGTYLGMIDHNVTTIVRALGGEVPSRGMNGLLEAGA